MMGLGLFALRSFSLMRESRDEVRSYRRGGDGKWIVDKGCILYLKFMHVMSGSQDPIDVPLHQCVFFPVFWFLELSVRLCSVLAG